MAINPPAGNRPLPPVAIACGLGNVNVIIYIELRMRYTSVLAMPAEGVPFVRHGLRSLERSADSRVNAESLRPTRRFGRMVHRGRWL